MTRAQYDLIEGKMLACTEDSAHDREHIYRVLHLALEIAATEPDCDREVLAAACLLHDIGRPAQFADSRVDHADAGAVQAACFLRENGFSPAFAGRVGDCIRTHRFRSSAPPESLEAKILFDADKIDSSGAMGVARTLLYQGQMGQPLYTLRPDGHISDGQGEKAPSFFREYRRKLEGLGDRLYTPRGRALAAQRRAAAAAFYRNLLAEARAAGDDERVPPTLWEGP
ncbi:HD domain-containing protein [Bittarella massiliensis (ex Durand et al. 2017)]|uniref:HD domain-containing protein n=1 Tax=Bittarella massiliensis (ex Durand et al. 2017) TaxID=1720313 RepID=A0AAW5KBE7_9FIRM|nr:HD domain-containing protein [Bittarella massiliensis (ex Durand et al. 2017)]MCQ4948284.1 HD domain-containing protein [Bittarella massiliensis (ex Durand et al. 2017)]